MSNTVEALHQFPWHTDTQQHLAMRAADEITRQRTTVLDLLGQVGQLSDEITRLRAENERLTNRVSACEEVVIEQGGRLGLIRAQNAELVAALKQIEYLDRPQVRGLPRRVSIQDIARAALAKASLDALIEEDGKLIFETPTTSAAENTDDR